MQLQLNTDHHLRGSPELGARLRQALEAALARFAPRITRVEVHLNDLNAGKAGIDKRCQMEARIAGRPPVSVQHVAESVPLAFDGALARLVAALDHALGKLDTTRRAAGRVDPTRLNGSVAALGDEGADAGEAGGWGDQDEEPRDGR